MNLSRNTTIAATIVVAVSILSYSYLHRFQYSESNIIAKMGGASIGDLKTAQMGVFQIVGKNSNEEYSWGGSFNTTSKYKTASITMDLTYELKN